MGPPQNVKPIQVSKARHHHLHRHFDGELVGFHEPTTQKPTTNTAGGGEIISENEATSIG